jgi:tetratricopeptide (TPR) repeat protein
MERRSQTFLVGIAIAAITAAVFLPSLSGAFLNWDDGRLIEFSAWRGFGPQNVRWWFGSFAGGDFKPLSWASYALDHSLWGLNPFGYHLGNIVLHSLNAALVFYLLWLLASASPACHGPGKVAAGHAPAGRVNFSLRGEKTRIKPIHTTQAKACGYQSVWIAVVAALFFSLHPLRVETVAWVTERKGCLSGFFFLLSLLLYAAYAFRRREGAAAGKLYLGSLLSGICACLAKPSALPLPFVLIILDIHPLKRMQEGWNRLIAEKVPYLLVSLVTGLLAIAGQRASSALAPMEDVSLSGRFFLSARAVFFYLGKTVWPFHLSPVYPQDHLSLGPMGWVYPIILAGVLFAFLLFWRRKIKWPLGAFLLYLVLLFPVSGFFRTGAVALADRFVYLPALAISLALGDLLRSAAALRKYALVVVAAVLVLLSFLTVRRQPVWRSSRDLWEEAAARAPSSALVFNNLGRALADEGRFAEAETAYQRALALQPASAEALTNLGNLRARFEDWEGAAAHYRAALKIDSRFAPEAHNNLGNVLARTGQVDEAVSHFEEALRLKTEYPEALNNLANTLAMRGDLAGAEDRYREAIRRKPAYPEAWLGLGGVLQETGRLDEAIECFQRCVQINPTRPDANYYLGKALSAAGRNGEAEGYFRKAAELKKQ